MSTPDLLRSTESPLPRPQRHTIGARVDLSHGVLVMPAQLDWVEGDRVHLTSPLDPEVGDLVELGVEFPGGAHLAMRLQVEYRELRAGIDLPFVARIVESHARHGEALVTSLAAKEDRAIETDRSRIRARWRCSTALLRDYDRSLSRSGLTIPWSGDLPDTDDVIEAELHLPDGTIVRTTATVLLVLPGEVAVALDLDNGRLEAIEACAIGRSSAA